MKEKVKNFLKDAWDSIGLFFWSLLPLSPIFAQGALIFLPVNSVWFWVLIVASIIPVILIRPAIMSCSQWHNLYFQNILATIIILILRLCGVFPF